MNFLIIHHNSMTRDFFAEIYPYRNSIHFKIELKTLFLMSLLTMIVGERRGRRKVEEEKKIQIILKLNLSLN